MHPWSWASLGFGSAGLPVEEAEEPCYDYQIYDRCIVKRSPWSQFQHVAEIIDVEVVPLGQGAFRLNQGWLFEDPRPMSDHMLL